MDKTLITLITAAIVVLVGGAMYALAPNLQDAERTVNVRADESAEAARRILDLYSADVGQTAAASEQLARAGLEDRLSGEAINRLAEDQSDAAAEAFQVEQDRLDDLLRDSQRVRAELDDRFAALSSAADTEPAGRRNFSRNVDGMARDMSSGLQDRNSLIAQNEKMLARAAATANESLNESKGDATGRDNLQANRLRGVALYHEGMAVQRRIAPLHRGASLALHRLADVSTACRATSAEARFASGGGLQDAVSRRQDVLRKTSDDLATTEERIDELEAQVADLRDEIKRQNEIANSARAQMESLEEQGLDYSQSEPAKRFREDYERQAAVYRQAVSAVHRLTHGSLGNARIDDSGDYIKGSFVAEERGDSIEYEPGLDQCERQLQAARIELEGLKQVQADQQDLLERLDKAQATYRDQAADAEQRVAALREEARQQFEAYNEQADRITELEDEALRKLEEAESAFGSAARIAGSQVTDVPQLAPEVKDRSPVKFIEQDRWLSAQVRCQAADAKVQSGVILAGRYDRLARAMDVLANVQRQVELPGLDMDALGMARDSARRNGSAMIEEAVEIFERAARDLNRHWTLVAGAASAYHAAALFGDDTLRRVALANYEAVIEGRDDNPLVQPYRDRLDQLRRSRGSDRESGGATVEEVVEVTVREEITLATEILDQYAGHYELEADPRVLFHITLEDGGLFIQASTPRGDQEKYAMYAESETEFFLKEEDAQVTFVRADGGEVTGLVLHQEGQDLPARKKSSEYVDPRTKEAVILDIDTMDSFVGTYRLDPETDMTITLGDDYLVLSIPRQRGIALWPESETEFFARTQDLTVTFVVGDDGRVQALILHRGDQDQEAKKVR